MTRCLGHLSKTYGNVLDQNIVMHKKMSSTVMQLLSVSNAFRSIAAQGGLSLRQTSEGLKHSLADFTELGVSELQVFSTLSFLVASVVSDHRKYKQLHSKAVGKPIVSANLGTWHVGLPAWAAARSSHMGQSLRA